MIEKKTGQPRHIQADPQQGQKKQGGRFGLAILSFALVLAGVLFMFGPNVAASISQATMNERIIKINALSAETSSSSPERSEDYIALRGKCESYNASLLQGGQAINDPFLFDSTSGFMEEVGIPDGLLGSVSIPAMSCELPVYLGSSEAHMDQGATIISGTSLPLGEPVSHCVIAAHRSRQGMFRDIQDMKPGDLVTVTTPWDVLTYAAVSSEIIAPNNRNALQITEDADMLTLFTCHPYGTNTSRYLVHCVRIDASQNTAAQGQHSANVFDKLSITFDHVKTGNLGTVDIERLIRFVGAILGIVAVAVFGVSIIRNRLSKSRR